MTKVYKVVLENTKTDNITEVVFSTLSMAAAYARYVNDSNTGVWATTKTSEE